LVGVGVMVVPVLNRYDLLVRLFESIHFPVGRLLIVDNGGRFNSKNLPRNDWVRQLFVWRMPSNLGVAPSWNLGIKATPDASGWLLMNSDAWFSPGSMEQMAVNFTADRIVRTEQDWACVWVGREVVAEVGLFSECFVPAYFEDNDYAWRCGQHGVVVEVAGSVRHDTSSTIRSDDRLMGLNGRSFDANRQLFLRRVADGITEPGLWSLGRRCEFGWD